MLKETFASGRAVLEARATAADNALMKAIIADLKLRRVAPTLKSSSRDD